MKNLFFLITTLLVSFSLVADAASRKKEETIEEISRDAYVWGYPAVLMSHTKKAMLEKIKSHATPVNHFLHASKTPDPFLSQFLPVNPENLYSWAWVDLSKEPLVLTHPATEGRFFSIQLVDAYTNVFHVISNENSDEKSRQVLLTAPGWEGRLPENTVQIRATTPEVFIVAQTFVKDTKEASKVSKLSRQHHLIPLSLWNQGVTQDSFKAEYPSAPAPLNRNLASTEFKFYEDLNQIVAKNPPPTNTSKAEIERFVRLGIQEPARLNELMSNAENKMALERGVFDGERQIQNRLAAGFGVKINGWSYELKAPAFTEDYLLRAAVAQRNLFSAPAAETLRLSLEADSESRQLSSSYRYLLHFEKDQFPPAMTMWSLKTYEMRNKDPELLARPMSLMNDRSSALKYNMDGSVDILVQQEKPSEAFVSNWLPLSKDANFYVVLTLFNPNNSALNRTYIPPSLTRLDDEGIPKQRITHTMMASTQEPVSK